MGVAIEMPSAVAQVGTASVPTYGLRATGYGLRATGYGLRASLGQLAGTSRSEEVDLVGVHLSAT